MIVLIIVLESATVFRRVVVFLNIYRPRLNAYLYFNPHIRRFLLPVIYFPLYPCKPYSNRGKTYVSLHDAVSFSVAKRNNMSQICIPKGMVPLSHQVGGHSYEDGKLGCLHGPNKSVLKPVQSPPKGEREMHFYQKLFSDECQNETLLHLKPLIPRLISIWIAPELPEIIYLELEDVTAKFKNPCIADIKMGAQTYDPDASPEKIAREKEKYPPLQKIKFKFSGMRVYDNKTGKYEQFGKNVLRKIKEEDVLSKGFKVFFDNGYGVRKNVIKNLLQKLKEIEHWFENQKELSFYASSLLFVYEGEQKPGSNSIEWDSVHKDIQANSKPGSSVTENDTQTCDSSTDTGLTSTQPICDLRMIDFTHVFETQEKDENYMSALRSLINYLNKLLET